MLTPASSATFITGGKDKTLRLWTVVADKVENTSSASLTTIAAIPSALACWGNEVFVGDVSKVTTIDLNHLLAPSQQAMMSSKVLQLHINSQDPNVIVAEVNPLVLK